MQLITTRSTWHNDILNVTGSKLKDRETFSGGGIGYPSTFRHWLLILLIFCDVVLQCTPCIALDTWNMTAVKITEYKPYLHSSWQWVNNIQVISVQDASEKYPKMKIAISEKCVKIFAPNFARLLRTKLHLSVMLCAVITSLITKWHKHKLQERISQLNKQLVL